MYLTTQISSLRSRLVRSLQVRIRRLTNRCTGRAPAASRPVRAGELRAVSPMNPIDSASAKNHIWGDWCDGWHPAIEGVWGGFVCE